MLGRNEEKKTNHEGRLIISSDPAYVTYHFGRHPTLATLKDRNASERGQAAVGVGLGIDVSPALGTYIHVNLRSF